MTNTINEAARGRIIGKFGIDLHDWLVSPELPDHDHAVACMQLSELVGSLLHRAGSGTAEAGELRGYSIALDIVMQHFLPRG